MYSFKKILIKSPRRDENHNLWRKRYSKPFVHEIYDNVTENKMQFLFCLNEAISIPPKKKLDILTHVKFVVDAVCVQNGMLLPMIKKSIHW